MIQIYDKMGIHFRGEVDVVIASENGVVARCRGHNEICDSAIDVIMGLMARDLDNKILSKISVGTGGDLDPHTLLDTGARVGPEDDEYKMRQAIFDASIANVEVDTINRKIIFTAVVKQESANSDVINEFGLLSEDGTMVAHYITPADIGTGRAERYVKTPLLFMVVRWTIYPTVVRT